MHRRVFVFVKGEKSQNAGCRQDHFPSREATLKDSDEIPNPGERGHGSQRGRVTFFGLPRSLFKSRLAICANEKRVKA
jgi:hypothetical protein